MVRTDTLRRTELQQGLEGEPLPAIAYLRPEGNFTHIAALELQRRQQTYEKTRLIGLSSIDAMFDAVSNRFANYAFVPVENSTDGAVPETHNNFYTRENLQIVGELVLPISLSLYYQDLSAVEVVASKDKALGASRIHIQEFERRINDQRAASDLDPINLAMLPTKSTGEAVAKSAKNPKIAAIGSSISADAQGLSGMLKKEDGFNDRDSNATTFALVQLAGELPPPTGNDKTTFTMTIPNTHGSLVHALDILARNNVDLNKIKSIGKGNGNVSFLMSADGHLLDGVMQEALIALENDPEKKITIKRLGSYAKDEYRPPETEETYDFEAAIDRINDEAANGDEMDEKKMIAVFTLKDHPGALRDALRPFADAGVNLTKIDSQPSGIHGEHIFYIAFEKSTENLEAILNEFKQQCHFHKVIPGGGPKQ